MSRLTEAIAALFRTAPPPPDLQRGQRGTPVADLQATLNAGGADLKVDGIFGPKTQAAVKAAQKANGLVVDGIVGKHTRKALR